MDCGIWVMKDLHFSTEATMIHVQGVPKTPFKVAPENVPADFTSRRALHHPTKFVFAGIGCAAGRRFRHFVCASAQALPAAEVKEERSRSSWFDWTTRWYPVAVEKELDRKVPHAVTILGYDLVLWWDKVGKSWQVFDDKCPHRLAPLSEGRIAENGHIQCSYHGWTFAPNSGSCSGIPQAEPSGPRVEASPRACAAVYPSMVQQGILWFLPDKTLDPKSVQQPPFFPVLEDSSFVHYWATSDLPYGYEALIENLMDPTHVNFAHHKLQGNRKNAKPVNYTVNKFDKSGFRGTTGPGNGVFMPPCSFMNEINVSKNQDGSNKTIFTIFMCVPVVPGKSKVFWSFPRNFARWGDFLTPMWLAHLRHMLVLDSDLYFLHLMEMKQAVDERCYTPTSADAFVMAFRRWLSAYAGGGPDYAEHVEKRLPPSPTKRQLMDRYENHVKKCPTCKGALRVFKAAEIGLQVAALATLAVLAAASVNPMPVVKRFSTQLAVVVVLLWIASRWTSHFIEKNYYFHDYNHALVE